MTTPIKLILVEDNEDDAALIIRLFKKAGYRPECVRVDSAKSLDQQLSKAKWDLVISDYSMPGFDGLKALTITRKHDRDIPFILVSGIIGENVAVAAMKAGAHDYLLKNNLNRLVPAVERELKEAVERRKRREAEQALVVSLQELKRQEKAITEKNIAMREVLSRIEEEKEEIKRHLSSNIEKLVMPTLNHFKSLGTAMDRHRIELLKKSLNDMTSMFNRTLRHRISLLSPRQLEICGMIKCGIKNKEISETIGISIRTVETHRNAIRRKLGIAGNDSNLITYLNAPADKANLAT